MFSMATLLVRLSGLLIAGMWGVATLVRRDPIWSVIPRVAWVMPTLFVVAILIPNVWLFFALLLLFLPVFARTKADAAAFYVVALVALPPITVYPKLVSIGLFPVDNYRVLSLGLLIAALLKPGPRGKISWVGSVPVLILFVLDSIAFGRGQNATSIMREIVSAFFHWVLPFMAVSLAVTRLEDVKRVVLAFIAAAGSLCVVAVYQAKVHWPMYEVLIPHFGLDLTISQGSKLRGGLMRASASFGESTSFGWYLAIALFLTIQSRERFVNRMRFYAFIALIGLGLLFTQARGPWLGVAIGLVLLDCFHGRLSRAALKAGAAAATYFIAVSVANSLGMFSEVLGGRGGAKATIDYRTQLLDRGLTEIRASPFWGYDQQTIQLHLADLRQGEGIIDFVNAYIFYGLSTGIIGVCAFAFGFMWSAWAAVRDRRNRGDASNIAAAAMFATSGMTLVTAGTSGFGGMAGTFFIILLALGAARPRLAAGRPLPRPAVVTEPVGQTPSIVA